jgi:hypothetical protein
LLLSLTLSNLGNINLRETVTKIEKLKALLTFAKPLPGCTPLWENLSVSFRKSWYVGNDGKASSHLLGRILYLPIKEIERERELHKEGRVVPSCVKLREGPENVTVLHWAKPTMNLPIKTYLHGCHTLCTYNVVQTGARQRF